MDRAAKELAKPGTNTTTADALQLNIILVFVVHRLHCLYTNAAPPWASSSFIYFQVCFLLLLPSLLAGCNNNAARKLSPLHFGLWTRWWWSGWGGGCCKSASPELGSQTERKKEVGGFLEFLPGIVVASKRQSWWSSLLLLLLLLVLVFGLFICLLLLRILSSLLCGDVDHRIVAVKLWSLAREWIGRRATESSEESVFLGDSKKERAKRKWRIRDTLLCRLS